MSRTRRAACVAVVSIALMPTVKGAGPKPPAQQAAGTAIRIIATGSFLGQFDGMVEYPGHSRDEGAKEGMRPYGGLLGVETVLGQKYPRGAGDLLLVAGDNQPHSFAEYLRAQDDDAYQSIRAFWSRLDKLNPTAVALWSEDFYRALAPPRAKTGTNAGLFAEWLADPTRARLLASNAAIRTHKDDINTIDSENVTLEVAEDHTISWDSELKVSFRCERKNLSYELTNGSLVQRDELTSEGSGDGPCHASIELKSPLRPGKKYTLTVRSALQKDAVLKFETDKALTPRSDDLPVIVPSGGNTNLPVIVSMVDQSIRTRLPLKNWEWTSKDAGMDCGGKKCEIVFHDATESFSTIQKWIAPHGERYFAMLGGLLDPDAMELLYDTNAIRFVVWNADTGALGIAADARDKGKLPGALVPLPYAGDAGNVALLDREEAPLARAWIRPQWIGATLPIISATVSRRDSSDTPEPGEDPFPPEWDVRDLKATTESVLGHRLCAEAKAGSRIVEYFVADHGPIKAPMVRTAALAFPVGKGELYETYAVDRAYDGAHEQGSLWIADAEFAALALHRMREDLHAEIAMFPRHTVDDDYIGYLKAEHDAGRPLNWLSREIVKRAIFRGDRSVRVKVAGADLPKTLEKLLSKARQSDHSYCVAGLGSTSCSLTKVDADHLRVNGRAIIDDHHYGIAIPSAIAAEFELKIEDVSDSLVELVDAAFKKVDGPVSTCSGTPQPQSSRKPAEVSALAERLEAGVARRMQPYFNLKPIDITGELVALDEPEGEKGSLAALNVASSGAQDRHKVAVDSGVDAGLDWKHVTLRGIAHAKYGEQRTETFNSETQQTSIVWSMDPDEYRVGPRLDFKLRTTGILSRVFVGAFQEGEFEAERFDSLPQMQNVKRRRHRFAEAGIAFEQIFKHKRFEFTTLSVSLTRGTEYADRRAVLIDGQSRPLLKDIGEVVKAYKDDFPGREIERIEFDYQQDRKTGLRVDAVVASPAYEMYGRKASVSLTTKLRQYWNADGVLHPEKQNFRVTLETSAPLWRMLNIGFTIDNERIVIRGAEDRPYSVLRGNVLFKLPIFVKRGVGIVW